MRARFLFIAVLAVGGSAPAHALVDTSGSKCGSTAVSWNVPPGAVTLSRGNGPIKPVIDTTGGWATHSMMAMNGQGGVTGQALSLGGLSGATGTELRWTLSGKNISISIAGGTGDADLYVKFGSAPTTSAYDCRPYTGGNNETCSVGGEGTFHIMVRGYSAFSGVTINGSTSSYGGVSVCHSTMRSPRVDLVEAAIGEEPLDEDDMINAPPGPSCINTGGVYIALYGDGSHASCGGGQNMCQAANACGGQHSSGCWCDDACVNYGDCCSGGNCASGGGGSCQGSTEIGYATASNDAAGANNGIKVGNWVWNNMQRVNAGTALELLNVWHNGGWRRMSYGMSQYAAVLGRANGELGSYWDSQYSGYDRWDYGAHCASFLAMAVANVPGLPPLNTTEFDNTTTNRAAWALWDGVYNSCQTGGGFWGSLAASLFGFCDNAADQTLMCFGLNVCDEDGDGGPNWKSQYGNRNTSSSVRARSVPPDALGGLAPSTNQGGIWDRGALQPVQWNAAGSVYGCWTN